MDSLEVKNIIYDTIDKLGLGSVIFYGQVVDVDDPLNLGRVRIEPKDWVIESYKRAYDVRTSDLWTNKDPFVFLPLLPIFFYQVPKKDEWCHVIFYNTAYTDRNKYYIQGGFSSPNKIKNEPLSSSIVNSALGERNKKEENLTQGTFVKNPENKDLYPEPGTIALLGRYNSDILLPEGGFVSRVNKIGNSSDINPTFNKRHSFNMFQNYKTRKVKNGKTKFTENGEVIQNLQYLIEYNVYGGLGSENGLFSGYINVYKISPYRPITTAEIDENTYNEIPEDSKIGPIYREDFTFETFDNITNGFRNAINNMNNSKLIVGNSIISQPFPFIFQPEKSFFDNYNPSVTMVNTDPTIFNTSAFILNVYLNQLTSLRGFGLVSEKDRLGKLTEVSNVELENIAEEPINITYGINVSDTQFILSHESQPIPGLNKIDFQDATYDKNILNQDFINDVLLPNTNSMVRGERLLELLELMVKFMINHVHPYHGMVPNNTSVDGTTTQKLLGEMLNAYNNMLNQNLRIN